MLTFNVNYDIHQGLLTIQKYARHQLHISLTSWRKFKHADAILLNGASALPGDILQPGDVLAFNDPLTIPKIEPIQGLLNIAYEDDYIIIINKPAGLLIHSTSNQQEITLANYVMGHYRRQNESHDFHPVHRLDRNTSGLILIAKIPYIQQQLSGKFSNHFTRSYLALVHGKLDGSGTIDAPLGRKPGSIIERMVTTTGKQAITEFKVIETFSGATLLQVTLLTCRTHQIRVHMAYIGHPLLGDDLYGGSRELIIRQALHSASLDLFHPLLQTKLKINSPLPGDMIELINFLRQKSDR